MSRYAFSCSRKKCIANKNNICMALYKKARAENQFGEGYIHIIDDEWIEKCPFYMTKEMEAKDLAKLKERLGIDGRRRK